MVKIETSCVKVSDTGLCPNCKSNNIIKNGFTKNNKQQYYCKLCKNRFIDFYTNNAYKKNINTQIVQFIKEGVGIRSTARILQISATTLLKRIIKIARSIKSPTFTNNMTY